MPRTQIRRSIFVEAGQGLMDAANQGGLEVGNPVGRLRFLKKTLPCIGTINEEFEILIVIPLKPIILALQVLQLLSTLVLFCIFLNLIQNKVFKIVFVLQANICNYYLWI